MRSRRRGRQDALDLAGQVRKHVENAYEKLDVHTCTGAVADLFARDALAITM